MFNTWSEHELPLYAGRMATTVTFYIPVRGVWGGVEKGMEGGARRARGLDYYSLMMSDN